MRHALFILTIMGSVALGNAQDAVAPYFKRVSLPNSENTNVNYLLKSRRDGATSSVYALQQKAAQFDPSVAPGYSNSIPANFEVIHKSWSGQINAIYNKQGELTETFEYYEDVALPKKVQQELFRQNPGWVMSGNRWTREFKEGEVVRDEFRIQLTKGTQRKTVVID